MGFQKFYKMTITLQNKKCTKCSAIKPIGEFNKRSALLCGVRSQCRECDRRDIFLWREKNPERAKQSASKWAKNNPEAIRKQIQKRNRKDPHWHTKYHNARCRKDINYKLLHNLRNRLYQALKRGAKKSSTLFYLGCSIQEFKQYLESQFKEGMSWDSYGNKEGQWSIDHINPCSSFDHSDEEQIKKCWHYSNMQPMWHVENLKKHARIA